jgi:hypothetical protein
VRLAPTAALALLAGLHTPPAGARRAAPPPRPTIAVSPDGKIQTAGLPAALPDGSRVAYVEHAHGYDDSSSDTLVIAPVTDGGRRRPVEVLALTETTEHGDRTTPLGEVVAHVARANQLVEGYVALPELARLREPGPAGGEARKASPYYILEEGPRRLVYSTRSGRLELTRRGETRARRDVTEPRAWSCCGRASREEGGCRAIPERLHGAWADERVLLVALAFSSGPDGCEVETFWEVTRLSAP